jgi:hypothetical protein
MPTTYSRRRRGPKPERRRALELLAASLDGCSEAIMLAHGFTVARRWTRDGGCPREDHGGWAAGTRGASMALILRRASASRPSGEWSDDDFDVLAKGGDGGGS